MTDQKYREGAHPRNHTPIVVRPYYTPSLAAALPSEWHNGLLCIGKAKQPVSPTTGRALADWLYSPVPSPLQLAAAPAVGLRTGAISSTVCLDFDGPEAWATFREVFGGEPAELLPRTIAWTSGKNARCQMAFRVPAGHQNLLNGKRRRIGALEIRWNGQQSVLLGFHPETGSYEWLPGCSPFEAELADMPLELLAKVPAAGAAPRRVAPQVVTQVERRVGPASRVAGLVVPLEQFITLRSRWLVDNGSQEGQCNDDAIRLSMDLVAAEGWLKAQGVGAERSARELFDAYCLRCPEAINGRPFDQRAMDARFEGAVRRAPTPPTPEDKLQERLAFHRRLATRRGTCQGVAA
jgi:hypothetical protein